MSPVPGLRLRERLQHDAVHGAWHDGPRRYLVLRPDSLMGALRLLDAATRETVFDALALSVQRHGGDSLRAYAAGANGDARALIAATLNSAADLGWGVWSLKQQGAALELTVQHSPFAAGWLAAGSDPHSDGLAVCAPIRGMLAALALALTGVPAQVRELRCAAQGHRECCFVAAPAPAAGSTGAGPVSR